MGTGPDKAERQAAGGRSPRRAHRGPTIADVAREAGVSPMTVSRTINGEARVQADTRLRVQQAIERLGFVPNAAARSLAGAQPCRLALIHDNPSAAWLSELLVGCLAQASEADAQLLVEASQGGTGTAALVKHLIAHRIDAVILPPPLCDDAALLDALARAGLPFVQVATGSPAAGARAVSIDDRAAAEAMTRHLIALGHRRIGFIGGNPNQSAAPLRLAGYRDALAEAGIAADKTLEAAGDFSYRSGLDAAEVLLALPSPPTAIFASNDDMAAAVISAAHRRGLDVPGALSVCGFDDTAIATTIWPELTTIRQPVNAMARAATRLAMAAARGQSAPAQEQFAHELVSRMSVACPKVDITY